MSDVEDSEQEAPAGKPEKAPAPADGDDDDDDDDDDESENDDAGGDDQANHPYLKGTVKFNADEGRLLWAGTWAFTQKLFEEGDASKFKYAGPSGASAEDVAKPKSGVFNGYFQMKQEEEDPLKVKEKGVRLDFKSLGEGAFAVSGGGTNQYGDFALKGTYDVASKLLICSKIYAGADESESDDDDADDLAAEEGEVDDLADEANMPIEELMKRYKRDGNGGGGGDDDDEPPAKKRPKVAKAPVEDEDEDDF